MPACPSCGEKVAGEMAFCPFCGESMRGAGKRRSGSNRGRPQQSSGSSGATIVIILVAVGFGFLVCGGILVALLLPAVQQARTAARKAQSSNNLKQIGLAFHNYHDLNNAMPIGGTYDENGRALHSWQTRLLPLLEMGPVYNQVRFDQPWDDAANAGAMSAALPVFLNPVVEQRTDPRGYGLSHYAGNIHVFPKNESLTLRDIIDGTSNTILAGEAGGNFKPWGDPTNLRDPSVGIHKGPDSFGVPQLRQGAQMLFIDGSVRTLSPDTSPDVLKALSTPAGKEQIGAF